MGENLFNQGRILMVELQALEDQGVSIWLDGAPSSSREVSQAVAVREHNSYMRDYVFDEGKISQLHFDRVDCE